MVGGGVKSYGGVHVKNWPVRKELGRWEPSNTSGCCGHDIGVW